MTKKTYLQPTMKVTEMKHRTHLLAGSGSADAHMSGTFVEEDWEE